VGKGWKEEKNIHENKGNIIISMKPTERALHFPFHGIITLSKFTLLICPNLTAASCEGCRERGVERGVCCALTPGNSVILLVVEFSCAANCF
jgi:hypothetical protein